MNTATAVKTFDEMGKDDLRAACKAAPIVGWGKMNNTQMRAALVAKQQADMEAKAAAEAASKPAVVAAQPANPDRKIQKDRPVRNDITRPSDGTICAEIWHELDLINDKGELPTTKDLARLAEQYGWNKHTASTQLQRWREYMGVMPRSQADKA